MGSTNAKSPEEIDRRIWATVKSIPEGQVCTYGQVAAMAGLGRAARRVGSALRKLPANSDVPWHRVLRSGGYLAFAPGSQGFRTQRSRLQSEGVIFDKGRIRLSQFGLSESLDELLWKPQG